MTDKHQLQGSLQSATAEQANASAVAQSPKDVPIAAGDSIMTVEVQPETLAGQFEGEPPAPPTGAEPENGFEGLGPGDQLQRFFDFIGIEVQGAFILSACFEISCTKVPGQWREVWTHQKAVRKGTCGDAQLFDTLHYGKHEPSNNTKGTLSSWMSKKSSETTRNWQYFFRSASFKQSEDHQIRSLEASNVERRRTYFVELDEGALSEQRFCVRRLAEEGLLFNAVVFSGGKSLHLHLTRPSSWQTSEEQDVWINQALCLLLNGDTAAQLANQVCRLPGFKRPGKHDQRLLGGRVETYGSYEELRKHLEGLLSHRGVEDLVAAYKDLKARNDLKKQRQAVKALGSSDLGREWEQWEKKGRWSEGNRTAARFVEIKLDVDNLIRILPKRAADLVNEGSASGNRNADGLYLTRELRGVVDVLADLVPEIEKLADGVLEYFIEASGGDVDEDRLRMQYDGAEGAMPGRPVADFMQSIFYETGGQLGEKKPKVPVLEGCTPMQQFLQAIGPGQWEENEDGRRIRPPKIQVGQFAEMVEGLGPALRWNDLTQQVEYNGGTLRPEEVEHLYVDLNKQDRFVTQKTVIDVVVSRSRVHRYDPVREYLEYVEQAPEIEPVDLGSLASKYLGTKDPLYDRMLRVIVIGAVARRMEPGCQFDYVVVLKGMQGIRKSTFWKTLASPDWYTTSVPDDDKDLLLHLHSTWLFELAELESVTSKRSAGKLKNIVSTSNDTLRVPYGKAPERRPRASVFVSTVNGDAFLRDETGERRYYVIECTQDPSKGEYIDADPVVRDRDRIWKAAMQAYRAGEKPYLAHELQHESNVRNEAYQVEHPWGPLLDAWLNPTECVKKWVAKNPDDWTKGAPEQFDSRQALIGCGAKDEKSLQKNDEMIISELLKKRGYTKTRVTEGKLRRRLWSKVEGLT